MQIGPPIESSQEIRRLDIGQQIMPGRTRRQTRDGTQLVEENLDDFYQDCVLMSAIVTGQNNEPKTSQEAWYHKNQKRRKKWRTVIRKEFRDMIKQGVWVNVDRSSIPEGRKLIGSKLVFKEKCDGRFWARLVCLGYSQIPGVDFRDNYAPVGNDVTFRIVMVLRLMLGFHAVLLDVETAFLYGKLEEEIYMEIPSGYKEVYQETEKGTVLKLQMAMYGLEQAARQWFKRLSDVLISLGFKPCESDPCLMCKVNENGLCIVLMYVDDNMIVGSNKAIDQVTEVIKNFFDVTVSLEAMEYLGCEIHVAKDNTCGWIEQLHLFKNSERKFGNIVKTQRTTETPSTPGFHVVRNIPNAVYITDENQKLYRSGVGMLLYLVKHSQPDLSNGTWELSKVMDKATEGHMKELCRVI